MSIDNSLSTGVLRRLNLFVPSAVRLGSVDVRQSLGVTAGKWSRQASRLIPYVTLRQITIFLGHNERYVLKHFF